MDSPGRPPGQEAPLGSGQADSDRRTGHSLLLRWRADAFAILALEQRGYRRFELAIGGLLGIVFLGFAYDLAAVGVPPRGIAGRPHGPLPG